MNITSEEYLEVLDTAPGDHHSDEFVEYLKKNSKIFLETNEWLVVENIKYHDDKLPWYTAFCLREDLILDYTLQLLQWELPEYSILLHSKMKRTVDRFHVHLLRVDKQYTVN